MPIFPSLQQFRRPAVRQTHLYLVSMLFVLLAGAAFGYGKVQAFLDEKQALLSHAALQAQLEKDVTDTTKAAQDTKESYGKELAAFQTFVVKVLPGGEEYTELTKQFDSFFDEHSEVGKNPIIAGSLRFGKGGKLKDSNFSALPVSLTVESSQENFFKFLNYIETSGSLETGVRLMDIQSIQLNFSKDEKGQSQVSFTVDLKAYYRSLDGNRSAKTPVS